MKKRSEETAEEVVHVWVYKHDLLSPEEPVCVFGDSSENPPTEEKGHWQYVGMVLIGDKEVLRAERMGALFKKVEGIFLIVGRVLYSQEKESDSNSGLAFSLIRNYAISSPVAEEKSDTASH